jgi:hypothetical protein
MGRVKDFVRDHLFPDEDEGQRVEIKSMMQAYRAWCVGKQVRPVDLDDFLDELEPLCRKLGIEIEVGSDQRVYALGVKIGASAPSSVH